jgi:signal peptidase II
MNYKYFARIGSLSKSNLLFGRWIIYLIGIDRLSKFIAHKVMKAGVYEKSITSWLSFGYTLNRGISWGILNTHSWWLTHTITAILVFINIIFVLYTVAQRRAGNSIVGETLVIIGGISNLIDRFVYGGVIDFIVLSYGNWQWPSFNIADSLIILGVIVMIYKEMRA